MALKRVLCLITVKFETGEEAPDDLRDAVIKSQGYMADKMNSEGIKLFNDLTKYLDISMIDYDGEALDAYEMLANACWGFCFSTRRLSRDKDTQVKTLPHTQNCLSVCGSYHSKAITLHRPSFTGGLFFTHS